MLAADHITPYLLARHLLDVASIVDGDLAVDAVGRRRTFKIIRSNAASYLLKQGLGADDGASLAREARVYEWLHSHLLSARLDRFLPRCYGYDTHAKVLVLELLPGAHDLRAHHARLGRFPVAPAAQVGRALGALHWLTRPEARSTRPTPVDNSADGRAAWVLGLHRPGLPHLRSLSAASIQFVAAVQSSADLCRHLDDLRAGWQTTALIHCDIKWDNCLVLVPTGPTGLRRGTARVKLVDWEHAQRGDPCWDAGSVFMDYLANWLFSLPIGSEVSPERLVERARYPLEAMQPALRAFWHAYARTMRLDDATHDRWLLRAVAYSAARLIQTGFEYMQEADRLSTQALALLQLSLNILRDPHAAANHLLGIPLRLARST